MALTMLDKQAEKSDKSRGRRPSLPNSSGRARIPIPASATTLVSESDRVRVWTIRLKPGERIGFHRHVLDYFWTARDWRARTPARARRHHRRIHLRARARPVTRPTGPASSRCTTWKTSATRTWSS